MSSLWMGCGVWGVGCGVCSVGGGASSRRLAPSILEGNGRTAAFAPLAPHAPTAGGFCTVTESIKGTDSRLLAEQCPGFEALIHRTRRAAVRCIRTSKPRLALHGSSSARPRACVHLASSVSSWWERVGKSATGWSGPGGPAADAAGNSERRWLPCLRFHTTRRLGPLRRSLR